MYSDYIDFSQKYYQKHYIASVYFEDDVMIIESGKKQLEGAKRITKVCYVRDVKKNQEVELTLQGSQWIPANKTG